METREFVFSIWYFKPSGKLYTCETVIWECRVCDGGKTPYMYDIQNKIKEMRRKREPMPGLMGPWDGPILINCEDGFPILILE